MGCSAPSARRYAATVTDSASISCEAIPSTPFIPPMDLKQLVDAAEAAWKRAHALSPPTPQGRVLHVVHEDESVRAWFDAFGLTTDSTGNTVDEGPNEVYAGDPHDDYVDLTFMRTTNLSSPNPPPPRDGGGKDPCTNLTTAQANITATDDGERVDGRIKRVESSYLGFGFSSCDAELRCTRILGLSGVAEE